jgi:zinc protease
MPSLKGFRTIAFFLLFIGPLAATRAADLALDYKEITLKNGMKVVTLEDFGSPIVAVQVWFHVGSKDELPERQGFAHMFEHMMFRGTDRLGSTDHFDLLRRTGGTCNAYTSFDVTVYHERLPADQLELALWLEAERIGFLKIDQKNYDTERKVVEEERRLGLNQPYGSLPEKLVAEIFPNHPYRWTPIGKIPHLRAAAVQELRDFFARYYVPNNATLVIVGAVKHEDAQMLARKYFEWMPREDNPIKMLKRDPLPTQARTITLRDDNAPAPACGIIWRTLPAKHDDNVPLDLLATILGGGDSSRLYREIVADKQLGVAALAASVNFEQDGLFGAGAVMAPFSGNKDKVLDIIRKQVEKIRTEPVSDKELTKAKNQMLAGIVTGSLTVQSKASLLGTMAVIEGDVSRVNRRLEKIRAVTAADLTRVAKEYLRPERALTVGVEQNLLGTVLGKLFGSKEEDAPITAKSETGAAPQAKPGLRRPADFLAKAPLAPLAEPKFPHDYQSKTLANGVKVYVVSRPQVPYLTVSLGLPSGAWTETKPGSVSMAMSMLTKGTARHNEKELAEELENYAIILGGGSGMDSVFLNGSWLTEHTDRAMGLFAETLLTPTFPATEFDKLKKQVRASLVISEAQPATVAEIELARRLYGSHPYARLASGTAQDVDALNLEDVKGWWGKFARPEGAVLIFAGDIAPDRAFELAEKALGGWKGEGPRPEIKLPSLPDAAATRIYLVDRSGTQSQIRIAQRSITRKDPLYPVARVVNGYFGDNFGSRLNETVRVKKGLTYGAGGGYSSSRFSGVFKMNTFSKTESTAAAVQLLLDELKRLRAEAPTEKELADTKSYMIGSVAGQHETPLSLANELLALDLEGLPLDYVEKTLGQATKTTSESCMKLIGQTPDPDKLVIVVVGPAERLREELEKIAPVTVVKAGK